MDIRFFLDTSIFIQSFDPSDEAKQDKAQALIGAALVDHIGIISYQVMQEFLHWSQHKFKTPLKMKDAEIYLEEVLLPLCEVSSETSLFKEALSYQSDTGYSFNDSMILAAAAKGGCRIIYGTQFKHGTIVGGMMLQNPFVKK